MPAHRRLPSAYLLKRMVDSGMTHAQIAAEFGVGRSAVSAELSRSGFTNPVRYDDMIPWRVKLEHTGHTDQWMLRVAHRVKHGGKVSDDEMRRYVSWKRKLDEANAVVSYVPKSKDGFVWVERREGDGELIRPPKQPANAGSRMS